MFFYVYIIGYQENPIYEKIFSVSAHIIAGKFSTLPRSWVRTHTHTHTHTHIRGAYIKFPDFFLWALLLIVHTWNSRALRNNFLRLQWICSTVSTTSGRHHRSPFVWACQWPSSQPLSSPQLPHNDSLWA